MIRFLASLFFVLTFVGTTAQAAFRRSDLESFQSLRDPFTPEAMSNLKHRPVSYFLANPPTVWPAGATASDCLIFLNNHMFFDGQRYCLYLRKSAIKIATEGVYNPNPLSSLGDLLNAITTDQDILGEPPFVKPSVNSDSAVVSFLGIVNSSLYNFNQQYSVLSRTFISYTIRFLGTQIDSFQQAPIGVKTVPDITLLYL